MREILKELKKEHVQQPQIVNVAAISKTKKEVI
jgi:hypothetical protein